MTHITLEGLSILLLDKKEGISAPPRLSVALELHGKKMVKLLKVWVKPNRSLIYQARAASRRVAKKSFHIKASEIPCNIIRAFVTIQVVVGVGGAIIDLHQKCLEAIKDRLLHDLSQKWWASGEQGLPPEPVDANKGLLVNGPPPGVFDPAHPTSRTPPRESNSGIRSWRNPEKKKVMQMRQPMGVHIHYLAHRLETRAVVMGLPLGTWRLRRIRGQTCPGLCYTK